MRILLTYDTRSGGTNERDATATAVRAGLEKLGHAVVAVDVTEGSATAVQLLESSRPDLAFNIARGRRGRAREALFPALFESAGVPFIGSNAFTSSLALDIPSSRFWVAEQGLSAPESVFVDTPRSLEGLDLLYPVVIKPNFLGCANGPIAGTRIERQADLRAAAVQLLSQYPDGIAIEQAVAGSDCIFPFVGSPNNALLAPLVLVRTGAAVSYAQLQDLDPGQNEQVRRFGQAVLQRLDVRDFGMVTIRIGDDDSLCFLEASTSPSLAAGSPMRVAAERAGLGDLPALLEAIVKSALTRRPQSPVTGRHSIPTAGPISGPPLGHGGPGNGLRVGLAFNMKRIKPGVDGAADGEAEFDSPQTIQAIEDAIASYGHKVVRLEATRDLPARLLSSPVDVVFNLAEGLKGRSREALVPALLELLEIPYTGSDPAALCLGLDKALSKGVVAQAGIPTPAHCLMETGDEPLPPNFQFPAIVKPVAEGSSKGIFPTSVVEDEAALRASAKALVARYQQPALAETYLDGREFTIALLGERTPRVLPPMEVVFVNPDRKRPVYAFDHKLDWSKEIRYEVPAQIGPELHAELERVALGVFAALGCRDVARIDVRLDRAGRVNFLDANPLPGLSPGWSDLCLIAAAAGMDYRALIGEILAPAIRRHRQAPRSLSAPLLK